MLLNQYAKFSACKCKSLAVSFTTFKAWNLVNWCRCNDLCVNNSLPYAWLIQANFTVWFQLISDLKFMTYWIQNLMVCIWFWLYRQNVWKETLCVTVSMRKFSSRKVCVCEGLRAWICMCHLDKTAAYLTKNIRMKISSTWNSLLYTCKLVVHGIS